MTPDPQSRQRMRDGSRLREITSRRASGDAGDGELSPRSAYEAVTRQMVRSLRDEVRDVKQRINQLITLIIAAILLEVLMRLIGV
jgi:hypothetical protein